MLNDLGPVGSMASRDDQLDFSLACDYNNLDASRLHALLVLASCISCVSNPRWVGLTDLDMHGTNVWATCVHLLGLFSPVIAMDKTATGASYRAS